MTTAYPGPRHPLDRVSADRHQLLAPPTRPGGRVGPVRHPAGDRPVVRPAGRGRAGGAAAGAAAVAGAGGGPRPPTPPPPAPHLRSAAHATAGQPPATG